MKISIESATPNDIPSLDEALPEKLYNRYVLKISDEVRNFSKKIPKFTMVMVKIRKIKYYINKKNSRIYLNLNCYIKIFLRQNRKKNETQHRIEKLIFINDIILSNGLLNSSVLMCVFM